MHRSLEVNLVSGRKIFSSPKIEHVHCIFVCGTNSLTSSKKSDPNPFWNEVFTMETDGTEFKVVVVCTQDTGEELIYGSVYIDFDYSAELKENNTVALFDSPLQNSIQENATISFIITVEEISIQGNSSSAVRRRNSQETSVDLPPSSTDSPLSIEEPKPDSPSYHKNRRVSTLKAYVKSRELSDEKKKKKRNPSFEEELEEEEEQLHRNKVVNLKVILGEENLGTYSGEVRSICDPISKRQVKVPDGYGKMIFPNNVEYLGSYKLGMRNGYGVLEDGKRTVKGLWRKNQPFGRFEIIYPNYDIYRGQVKIRFIPRKRGKKQKPEFSVHCLELNQIIKHGTGGFYNSKSAHYYFGTFLDDFVDGFAIELNLKRGEKYSGYWKAGERSGDGCLTRSNGSLFFGSFKNHQRVKAGEFYLSNGYHIDTQFGKDGKMKEVKLDEGEFDTCPHHVLKLVENDIKRYLMREEDGRQRTSTQLRHQCLWQALIHPNGEEIIEDLGKMIPFGVHYKSLDAESIMVKILSLKRGGLVRILQFFCEYFKRTYTWLLQVNQDCRKSTRESRLLRRSIKYHSVLLLAKEDLSSFLAHLERVFISRIKRFLKTDSLKGRRQQTSRTKKRTKSGSGNILRNLCKSPEFLNTASNLMIEEVVKRFRKAFHNHVNGYVHQHLYDTLYRVYCQEFKEKEMLLKQKIRTIRHSLTRFDTESKIIFLEFRLDRFVYKYHYEYLELRGCQSLLGTIKEEKKEKKEEDSKMKKTNLKMDIDDFYPSHQRFRGKGEKNRFVKKFQKKGEVKESLFLTNCVSSLFLKIELLVSKYPELKDEILKVSPRLFHELITQRPPRTDKKSETKNQFPLSDFVEVGEGDIVPRDSEWLTNYFENEKLKKLNILETDLRIQQIGLVSIFRRREIKLLKKLFPLIQTNSDQLRKNDFFFRINLGEEHVVVSKKISSSLDFGTQLESFLRSYQFVEESLNLLKKTTEDRYQSIILRNREYFRSQFMSLCTTLQSLEFGMNYFSLKSIGKITQTKKSCQSRIRSIIIKIMHIKSKLERELLVVDRKDIQSEIDMDLDDEFLVDEIEGEGEREDEECSTETEKLSKTKIISSLDMLLSDLMKSDIGTLDIILETSTRINSQIRNFVDEFPQHNYLYERWKTVFEHQKAQYIFRDPHLQVHNLKAQIRSTRGEVKQFLLEVEKNFSSEFEMDWKSLKLLFESFDMMLESIERDISQNDPERNSNKNNNNNNSLQMDDDNSQQRPFITLNELFGTFGSRISSLVRLLEQILNQSLSLEKKEEEEYDNINNNNNNIEEELDLCFLFFQFSEDCYLLFKRNFHQISELKDCYSQIHEGIELLFDLETKKAKGEVKKELSDFYEIIDEGNLILQDYGKYEKMNKNNNKNNKEKRRRKRKVIMRGVFFRNLRIVESCVCLLEGVRSLLLSWEYSDIQRQNERHFGRSRYNKKLVQIVDKMLHDACDLQKEKKIRTVERYLDTSIQSNVQDSSIDHTNIPLPLQLLGVPDKFVPPSINRDPESLSQIKPTPLSSSISSTRADSLDNINLLNNNNNNNSLSAAGGSSQAYHKSISQLNKVAGRIRPGDKLRVFSEFDLIVSEEMKEISKKMVLEEDDALPVILYIFMQSQLNHYAEFNYIIDWMDKSQKTQMITRYELFFKYIENLDPYLFVKSKGELLDAMGNILAPLDSLIQERISNRKMNSVTWIVNLFDFIYCEIGRREVEGYFSMLEVDQISLRNSILGNRENVEKICTKEVVGFQVMTKQAFQDKIEIQFFQVYSPNIYKFLSEHILKKFQSVVE